MLKKRLNVCAISAFETILRSYSSNSLSEEHNMKSLPSTLSTPVPVAEKRGSFSHSSYNTNLSRRDIELAFHEKLVHL